MSNPTSYKKKTKKKQKKKKQENCKKKKKKKKACLLYKFCILKSNMMLPGRIAQSVGHLTRKSGVLGSIPGLATYFRFSFHFFKKGSCQSLAKVCARSTG